jgi:gamma-glutamylcyclotransferase (GGCT)/AIG2-like uncharacterized protein YtfP
MSADGAPQFLFVYGLLMRGLELHALLSGTEFVGEATTNGTLVSFGEYPGLIDGEGTVRGELYDIANSGPVLATIDEAEEFDPGNVEGSLYRRVARDVRCTKIGSVRAWVYLYNRLADSSQPLTEGSWRDR